MNTIVCPQPAIDLIKQFEGFSAKPYKCPAGKATIGYGSTTYLDGEPVLIHDDEIDHDKAVDLVAVRVAKDWHHLKQYFGDSLNLNQMSACLSFTYNLGLTAFMTSSLCTKIKISPSDAYIIDEFLRWNKVRFRGEKIPSLGLTRRRLAEATLYFTPVKIA